MLAFKTGDARAFSTLVQRHRGPVYNFILRYVGHRQRAEDLLQEFERDENRHHFERDAGCPTWHEH